MEQILNLTIEEEEGGNEDPPNKGRKEENEVRDISIISLSTNLFNLVCMFLKAQDFVSLICSNKKIKEKIESHSQFALSALAQRLFFSSEIDRYVDYGDEACYLQIKSKKDLQIADFMKKIVIDQLRNYSLIKASVELHPKGKILSQLFPKIHNPPIPTMKIRRDNVGLHAHSWFQNKLVDVFFDNQQQDLKQVKEDCFFSELSSFQTDSLSFMSRYQPKALKQLSKQIQKEQSLATENRCIQLQLAQGRQRPQAVQGFLEAIRWYRNFNEIALVTGIENDLDINFENNNSWEDFTNYPQIKEFIQENECILTILIINSAFKHQCEVTKYYLDCNYHLSSFYDLLSEYNLKWNAYQASIIEAQDNFEEVYSSFNELYQVEAGVKIYPQYSLLRAATQHWANIVFSPLKDRLFEAFFSVLQDRRLNNLEYIITSDASRIDHKLLSIYYFPDKIVNTPKEIEQKYLRSSLQLGIWQIKECDYERKREKNKNDFFSQNGYFTDSILSSFSENMMDLSVNEASVHWLGHSEIQVGTVYSQFSQLFLEVTSQYFDHLSSSIFSGFLVQQNEGVISFFSFSIILIISLEYFFQLQSEWKQFLLGELKYNRKIVKELTLKNLNKLTIEKFFSGFSLEVQENICSADSSHINAGSSKEDLHISSYLLAKGLSEFTINRILNDYKHKKLLQEIISIKEQEEEFNQKIARDEDIEDINRYRRIKRRLDEDSFTFYDIIGQVSQNLIESTKKAIRQKEKLQHQKESQIFQNKQQVSLQNLNGHLNHNFIYQTTQNIPHLANQKGGRFTFPLPLFHPPNSSQRVQQRNQSGQSQRARAVNKINKQGIDN